jgi:hypothetical protein
MKEGDYPAIRPVEALPCLGGLPVAKDAYGFFRGA